MKISVEKTYHPVVRELVELISKNGWKRDFEKAIKKAGSYRLPFFEDIKDLDTYLDWINDFLYWVPFETASGKNVDDHLSAFYFVADQEPVLSLQNKVAPRDEMDQLTPFSEWLVKYAGAIGEFLDTPESLTAQSEQSFYDSPYYNMHEYLRPRGGWKSFNQIFARHFKPGYRPIAAIKDDTVIVMPADSTFAGQWEIRKDAQVTVKDINWKISELLEGSPFKDRFDGGLFMHSYLGPADYHRQHAPVGGKVVEARVIHGQVYQEVEVATEDRYPEAPVLKRKRSYDAKDNLGYQFAQTRGLIVLDTSIGLVAVLPIGMCQVSSVVVTAEVGVSLRKGEELSYFQFGGSDIILLFESSANVCFTAHPSSHYKVGNKIAQAHPVN